MIGADFWEDRELQAEGGNDSHDFLLSMKDMQAIREDISKTIRPTWHEGPPPNFGQPVHGKLKADQWRSTIEFDLPVSLMRILVTEMANGLPQERIRKRELQTRSTILLATAIRWGTSHKTSSQHASEYKRNIVEYLHTVRQLRPDRNLTPNHHYSVHYGDLLPLFGPAHSWWAFPFERLIGLLQKFKTNFKIGECSIHGARK